jgi:hypothetical protein
MREGSWSAPTPHRLQRTDHALELRRVLVISVLVLKEFFCLGKLFEGLTTQRNLILFACIDLFLHVARGR